MIDFSGSNERDVRAHCIEASAAYAAALLAAGFKLSTGWTRSVRERAPVLPEPPTPIEAIVEETVPLEPAPPVEAVSAPPEPPTMPSARSAPPTATDQVTAIAARAELTLRDLRSVKRTKLFVTARQEAMYALRMEFDWSYPQIGQFLRRDHSSVINGVRKHAARHGLPAPR